MWSVLVRMTVILFIKTWFPCILITLTSHYIPYKQNSLEVDNDHCKTVKLESWSLITVSPTIRLIGSSEILQSAFCLQFMTSTCFLSKPQFRSVAQSCPTLCNPTNCSTPGLPVHHQLLESNQTRVHQVDDAIQPSHPLSSPSPPALNLSQHQGLFQWVSSSHQVAKVLEFQPQHQPYQRTPRTYLL